jgi:hypothetical protein
MIQKLFLKLFIVTRIKTGSQELKKKRRATLDPIPTTNVEDSCIIRSGIPYLLLLRKNNQNVHDTFQ